VTAAENTLVGKRIVVTGGASGIGQATTARLLAAGARVAVIDRTETPAEQDADSQRTLFLRADVGVEEEVERSFARCQDAWGGLDGAVLNAGIHSKQDAAVHELTLEGWQQTLTANLTGMFVTAKYAVRALIANGGGAIVMTGSPTGIYGVEDGFHAYAASKGGVHGLARAMAREYARRQIRVNVVVPGLIRTGINTEFFADRDAAEAAMSSIPLGREGSAAEIAAMIAFLLSDEASYATGGLFTVDGGLTAQ
jgi:NAD(P)-dependent dehydrogenase (short-subunit alcohol dehydrogenase family)